ncbi:ATP-binding protein [Dactylosporangium sp. NPDC051541]|uniref:ATP-binding protein n=1 Tax=Dactylosporangium sp. NPDC051541 TaxID=3363977 RepID=UPI0037A7F9E8
MSTDRCRRESARGRRRRAAVDGDLVVAFELGDAAKAGGCTLHVWTAADALVLQVADGGVIRDPLAGRRPVTVHSEGGRGLLLTHRMCDLVELCTGPSGTAIRVHIGR